MIKIIRKVYLNERSPAGEVFVFDNENEEQCCYDVVNWLRKEEIKDYLIVKNGKVFKTNQLSISEFVNELLNFGKEKFYKIGDRFISNNGEEYILASLGCSECCLIGLNYGIMYSEPHRVRNMNKITQKEFNHISSFHSENFKLKG